MIGTVSINLMGSFEHKKKEYVQLCNNTIKSRYRKKPVKWRGREREIIRQIDRRTTNERAKTMKTLQNHIEDKQN